MFQFSFESNWIGLLIFPPFLFCFLSFFLFVICRLTDIDKCCVIGVVEMRRFKNGFPTQHDILPFEYNKVVKIIVLLTMKTFLLLKISDYTGVKLIQNDT